VLGRIRRFVAGLTLPIKGGTFLLRHRRLLLLALAPLLVNSILYVTAVVLFIYYSGEVFSFIMERPDTWYMLIVYYLLRILVFLITLAVFVFSFVFVGTVVSAPFLELLSERTEEMLQGRRGDQSFQFSQWAFGILRSIGHTVSIFFLLAVTFPLSFIPVLGHAAWLGLGWILLAYDFTGFVTDRRQLSFREKWQVLLSDLSGSLGFGAAIFFLTVIPLFGLVSLPLAAVAGTMLSLEQITRRKVSARV
jgi:CysZ protein